MDSVPLTLTLLNLFSQHSHYADIMKLAWKSTQRLSALHRGTQREWRRGLPSSSLSPQDQQAESKPPGRVSTLELLHTVLSTVFKD